MASSKGNSFSKDYWQENYNEPEEMDGIVNAKEHAQYLKALFAVEYIDINSIIDFGFGLGYLFEEMIKEFKPYRSFGLEPSQHAFDLAKRERNFKPVESGKLTLKNWSLEEWADHYKKESKKKAPKRFDLGICTSVFQYLPEETIEKVLPLMASQVKYLYFSVPTDKELKRQVSELEFKDRFALRRPKKYYKKAIKPHFTIVGNRLLESKVHFKEDNSFFTDYLFRE